MPGELQKALKEAIKAKKCGLGARTVATGLKKSKLLIVSSSAPASLAESAEGAGVPVVRLGSTSVELGRLCGRQHRVSAVSFTALAAAKVKAIEGEVTRK